MFRFFLFFAFSCGFLVFFAPLSWGKTTEEKILHNTLSQYLLPSYLHLEKSTEKLSGELSGLCAHPALENLHGAKKAFSQVVLTWGSVEWFRFGPALQENRVERFFFFPDRKGRGLRQVRATLKNQDSTVLRENFLREKSVALQGLGALEFLLFEKKAALLEEKQSFHCQFAESVGKNLHTMAKEITSAWQEDKEAAKAWKSPSANNPFFRTNKEAMNALLGSLVHGLQAVQDTRIQVFLQKKASRDKPKSAAFWRSELTLPSVAANLAGFEKLFSKSRIEELLPPQANHLGDSIRFEFRQTIDTAKELEAPVTVLLNQEDKRRKLEYLSFMLKVLLGHFNEAFIPATNLATGFSFGDGD